MDKDNFTGIIIETLEVFINNILYMRDIYPARIFKKRKFYNTPVYASIYPPLNTYICNVLKSARNLLHEGHLKCVELYMLSDERELLESYKFQLLPDCEFLNPTSTTDQFLLEFEEQIRACLLKLQMRGKLFEKIPKNTSFKILLHTTQTGHTEISQNPTYQDFLWVRSESDVIMPSSQIQTVPMSGLNRLGLQITIDVAV